MTKWQFAPEIQQATMTQCSVHDQFNTLSTQTIGGDTLRGMVVHHCLVQRYLIKTIAGFGGCLIIYLQLDKMGKINSQPFIMDDQSLYGEQSLVDASQPASRIIYNWTRNDNKSSDEQPPLLCHHFDLTEGVSAKEGRLCFA